jgi:glycosyltransferase involved in cell wall biosynthesis
MSASHRIRLLQLVHGYPPAVGGVELSIRDLCEHLVAEHGFEVTVLTTNAYTVSNFIDGTLPTIPIASEEVQNGVRVLRFPVQTTWSPILRYGQRVAYRLRLPGNDRLRTWWNGPISPGLFQATRTLDADVVCAASFPLNHMRYPFLRPEPRPPVVLIGAVHTNDRWGYERPHLLRLVNRSYATIAHTDHERDWLVGHGAQAERLRVIGHGIDPDELQPRPGAFRMRHGVDPAGFLVAYVGQQGAHKGIETLLAAFPHLLERLPDAWLAVCGSRTPHSPSLERVAATLPERARSRVRLVADLSQQEKADVLGDCDVFASPSRAESFGITTLEAWSLGKPVVVGDSPSQRSIVADGETGLIVPYGDVERLVDALDRLADRDVRARVGAAGRATVLERYRKSEIDRRYADLLREAAAEGRRGPG